MAGRDVLLIRTRANEAMLYFRLRQVDRQDARLVDPRAATRSPDLLPPGALIMETTDERGQPDLYRPSTAERQLLVQDVADKRSAALQAGGVVAPSKALLLAGGRVLLAHLDHSDGDAVAHFHSRGLFDPFDVPGHDTWLQVVRTEFGDTLVAYIPADLLPDAEPAAWACPTRCLAWLDPEVLAHFPQ